MTSASVPVPATSPRVERALSMLFFGTGTIVSLAAAALYTVAPLQASLAGRLAAVLASVVLAVVFAAGGLFAARLSVRRLVLGVSWAVVPMVFVASVAIGEGMRAPNLGFFAVVVCIVTVLVSLRHAVAIAAVCATGMLVLAAGTHELWLPGAVAADRPYIAVRLLMQWMLLGAALAAGLICARMLGQSLDEALERERRFRGLLRIAVDRYWETDAQLRFTQASYQGPDGRIDLERELVGRTPWELDEIGLEAESMRDIRDATERQLPFANVVARYHARKGRIRYISLSGEPRYDAAGRYQGYWGVGRDVTAEVRAQQALRASEGRYQALFSRSPAPLVLHREKIIVDANEAAAKLFGFDSVEAMHGSALRTLEPAGAQPRNDAAPAASGVPETRMRTLDGRMLTVQERIVQVDTAHGPALLSMYHDITALAAAEAAMRRSEALMSHLFSTNPDVITLTEVATGRYLMVNKSFERLTGYAAAEVIGRTSTEIGIWHSVQERDKLIHAIREQGSARDLPLCFVAKSGEPLTLHCSAARFTLGGRDYLVANARDASARDRVRLELQAILQRASIGIAFTRDNRFVQVNPRFAEMLGWTPEALVGQPGVVVWPSEADYAEIGRLAGPLLSVGQPVEIERHIRRQDGSLIWCRLIAQAVDPEAPRTGGTVWIAEDISERRRAEQALAAARDAAEAANRAKSAFLANTSHEIRTPLNGILGMAELAMQDSLDEQRRQVYLQQVLDSAQNLASIISDILDISKVEAGKLGLELLPFNLHETLRSVQRNYHPLAESKELALTLAIADDVPVTVNGDAVRVRQILSNFVSNALKFTERGTVHIDVRGAEDSKLRLAVRDTGVGIDNATLAQLFVPFSQADQSITRRYGGTGLGLSICRELAQLMQGHVGVQSRIGEGSEFFAVLRLPQAAAPGAVPDGEDEDLHRIRGAHVLLAEDNPVNMLIGVALLEQWGVRVTEAGDGAKAVQAVERAAAAGEPFDLVLMDVQMPQMSGYAAARELRRHHDARSLPIVALTAAALVSEREEALAAGMNDFLTKPIDAARLRRALAMHLRASSRAEANGN